MGIKTSDLEEPFSLPERKENLELRQMRDGEKEGERKGVREGKICYFDSTNVIR